MRRALLARMAGVVFCLASSLQAAPLPADDTCPPTLRIEARIVDPLGGWESTNARVGEPLERQSVAFFAGPISAGAQLKPQRIRRGMRDGAETFVHQYTFLGRFPEGVSMSCRYGSTSVVVHKVLSAVPGQCTVSFSSRPARGEIAQVVCQAQ